MSRRSRWRKESCWERRTGLEKILIGASVVVILIVIASVVLLLLRLANASRYYTCKTPECINETSEIIQRINPSANPCDDFYDFSCGNLLKEAHGDENLGPFLQIKDQSDRQIEGVYSEPIEESDRRIVKISKKLYRSCLNKTAIKTESLRSIKHSLRSLGGWPVAEGEKWDGSTFWWLEAMDVLRKLGHFHASFLDITVQIDPENEDRYIFKVSVPDVEDFKGNTNNAVNWLAFMVDVAVGFGAKRERAIIEMAETYEFMLDMRRESFLYFQNDPVFRMQLGEYQKQYEFFNWQEVINKIIYPAIRIYEADYLLFSSPRTFERWFNFLAKTPNRILANYMIWKAIEEVVPFTQELQNFQNGYEYYQNRPQLLEDSPEYFKDRPEYCMNLIRKSFYPSPLDVMYLRKYLPEHKRARVYSLIRNLQYEFINIVDATTWMEPKDKEDILQRAKSLKVIVGAPGDYFDNEILDELDLDLADYNENDNFVSLLLKTNRNHQSHTFAQFYNFKANSELNRWSLKTHSTIGDYNREENFISIPATILQSPIYNVRRPECLNYGSMGTMMGHHFLSVLGESTKIYDKDGNLINTWSNKTREYFDDKTKCVHKQMENLNATNQNMVDFVLHQSLGLKLSYNAYNTWAAVHEDEAKTILGLNYTSDQLFWISAASYFCQPLNQHSKILRNFHDERLFALIVSESVVNSEDFAKSFECVVGSKMSPVDKCEIF